MYDYQTQNAGKEGWRASAVTAGAEGLVSSLDPDLDAEELYPTHKGPLRTMCPEQSSLVGSHEPTPAQWAVPVGVGALCRRWPSRSNLHTAHVDVASYEGSDWTKPYPGTAVQGFQAHLRIANDVPWPADFATNQTTEVTALTFSLPGSLMDESRGLPKPMDPSWFICQHYFVSALPDPTEAVDHGCGFLPAQCRADMETSLTGSWALDDPDVPCSALLLDSVPVSCQDSLGLIRGDVIGKFLFVTPWSIMARDANGHPSSLELGHAHQRGCRQALDGGRAEPLVVGHRHQRGCGGNETAYYEASNRTFIIGTVFGYSSSVTEGNKQPPKLSLACLRPEWVPSATPNTTTSTAAPYVYSTQTSAAATTAKVSTTPSVPPSATISGPVCVSGAASPNRSSGDFEELCSFSCGYGYCPPTACQCLEYSDTPRTAPDSDGPDGCPLEGVTDDDFIHLCSFACERGTCPESACCSC
ncbi:hypothetical protein CPLU01_14853 [Colletotrichum plurivorum]|uniref:Uncharacterized protein n=1 Tax=Colletotrichum plurivorum TaxID=2175906 RepID=A0A8H6JGR4_9PEZI|nr:hypothetical protein CPLU01_14853 [Colletotrichum plurivorum]